MCVVFVSGLISSILHTRGAAVFGNRVLKQVCPLKGFLALSVVVI